MIGIGDAKKKCSLGWIKGEKYIDVFCKLIEKRMLFEG
jgi:hypothetical protein